MPIQILVTGLKVGDKLEKYLIETDVLVDHLTCKNKSDSYLQQLMQKGICFTSVFNASEILFKAKSKYENQMAKDLLYALKVLGIHSRYSLLIPKYAAKFNNVRDALFYILADLNKLTIVSLSPEKYMDLNSKVIHPSSTI